MSKLHFDTIEDLLACADKIIAKLRELFPNVEPEKLKIAVLDSLLKTSTLKP